MLQLINLSFYLKKKTVFQLKACFQYLMMLKHGVCIVLVVLILSFKKRISQVHTPSNTVINTRSISY